MSTPRSSALPPERWAWLLVALAGAFSYPAFAQEHSVELENGEVIRYQLIAPGSSPSARDTARRLLEQLARGEIEQAAKLSNAPERRAQVLRDYQASVGEPEFKRVFAEYSSAPNRIAAELAVGERHLVIWDLAGADHHLAAQYFVRSEGGFLLDDVPSEARLRLTRLLRAYRAGRIKPSAGTG